MPPGTIALQRIDFAARPQASGQHRCDFGTIGIGQPDPAQPQGVTQMPGMAPTDDHACHLRQVENIARCDVGEAGSVPVRHTPHGRQQRLEQIPATEFIYDEPLFHQ